MQYSITRLLVLKKSRAKQLEAALDVTRRNTNAFVEVLSKSSLKEETKTRIKQNQQARFDEIKSHLKAIANITAAISASNAITKVVIAGKEMTVAEALAKKESIKTEQVFIANLSEALSRRDNLLAKTEAVINAETDKRTNTALGGEKGIHMSPELQNTLRSAVEAQYAVEAVCFHSNLDALVADMRKELNDFIAEVDVALNESNAITKIDLEL